MTADRRRVLAAVDVATRLLVGIGCMASAAAAVAALRLGVRAYDPWLFPMLVVLPAAVSAVLGMLVFAPFGWRLNAMLAGMSMVAGLYALETVLHLLPDQAAEAGRAEDPGSPTVETRTRLEVALQLRQSGVDAWPLIGGHELRRTPPLGPGLVVNGVPVAPLAQLRNTTVVGCRESGDYPLLRMDEEGFNNPRGSWQRQITVALVGDSHVEGSCIDPAHSLVAGMQQHIPGAIAAGLSDSGPLVMLGLIKEYVARVRPDDVFWFFYEGNDLTNLVSESRTPGLRRYLEPDGTQNLRTIRDSIEAGVRAYLTAMMARRGSDGWGKPSAGPGGNRLWGWARLMRLRRSLGVANVHSRLRNCCDLADFRTVLDEANRTVRAWGGRLHFVYLPAAGRYYHPMSALLDDNVRYRTPVLRLVNELGLPIVDIHDRFEAAGNPRRFFYSDRSHFNEEGYAVIVDAVYEYLEADRDSVDQEPHD